MKNPEVINIQNILLEKKFARKKRSSIFQLIVLLVIFFSLLVIKSYANDVSQVKKGLHTAAGAVSYSNLAGGKKPWVK
tara:strand:- start:179 stop:412 length:234 start_codon:yes stop_codon:yes gene_type:complete